MKPRFVQIYLWSAAVILFLTALGKAIPVPVRPTLCIVPIISHPLVLWTASALEFGIVALICLAPERWLPCLACGAWGTVCLLMRLIFLGPAASASCDCLGWFQHLIPLPADVLSNILLVLAIWLSAGGFVSFRLTRRTNMEVLPFPH